MHPFGAASSLLHRTHRHFPDRDEGTNHDNLQIPGRRRRHWRARRARRRAILSAACLPPAVPAVSQYPQQTYPGYPQGYGYNQGTGNPVTDIIDQLLGNRYNVTDRQAVRQCANAARNQALGQYGGYGRGYGYNQGNRAYANNLRVTAITNVERRSNGLRVSGTMGSGAYANHMAGNMAANTAIRTITQPVSSASAATSITAAPSPASAFGRAITAIREADGASWRRASRRSCVKRRRAASRRGPRTQPGRSAGRT